MKGLQAVLEIRYGKIRVPPPIGKQQRYPALTLTVIHAEERGTPKNRKKIEWKLITDLPVESRTNAIEKLEWYALRWKIEVFYKILKSGCKAEESKLRTAQRLTNVGLVVHESVEARRSRSRSARDLATRLMPND